MTTFAITLKDEMRRLARKEIKAQTATTARAVAHYRREIAKLKRQMRQQEKAIAFLEAQARQQVGKPAAAADLNGRARFSARSVNAQRRKTGLSAADYAKLVGVSPLTIYNWEHGKSRPRKEQLASLVSLRSIGKRDALARLELLNANGKKPSRKPAVVRRKKA